LKRENNAEPAGFSIFHWSGHAREKKFFIEKFFLSYPQKFTMN